MRVEGADLRVTVAGLLRGRLTDLKTEFTDLLRCELTGLKVRFTDLLRGELADLLRVEVVTYSLEKPSLVSELVR